MQGIKRVSIENFQSIAQATFELEKGKVYAIHSVDPIKRNNIGKSVMMSALMLIAKNVNNLEKKYYIRDNEKTLRVRVEDFDDNVVEWARGEEDYYAWTINGASGRVDKTNGKVPEEVTEYFNFHFAHLNSMNKQVSLNMLTEEGLLYFVTTTDNDNYLLLKDLIGTDECVQALKKLKEKRSELESERKLMETRIEDLVYSTKLVEEEVVLGNQKEMALKECQQKVGELTGQINELEQLVVSISKYLAKKRELAQTSVEELTSKRVEAAMMLKALRELKRLKTVQENLDELQEEKQTSGLDSEAFEELDAKYKETLKVIEGINQLKMNVSMYLRKKKELATEVEEHEKLLKEKAELEKELKYCPVCHSSLGGDTHGH